MSVRVMTLVWELDLPDSDKLVLLALADSANDEGHCWPSVRSLVAKCSKSDRTIQGSIKRLVDEGHLTRREVPGKGCNYTVHPSSQRVQSGERHYLYRTEKLETGEYYVGARSCFGPIEKDAYLGSGEWVKEQIELGATLTKAVIGTYLTRDDLALAEQAATASVFGQPLCKNKKIATPATLSGRSNISPKGTTQTPEAASDKPLRTTNSEAKASSQRVIDHWNLVAKKHSFAEALILDASRRQTLRLRIKEHGEDSLIRAFDILAGSAWMRGQGRDSKWKPDLDFALRPATLRRALEGSYGEDEKPAPVRPYQPTSPDDCERAAQFWESQGNAARAAEVRALGKAMHGAPVGSIAQKIMGRVAAHG